NDSWFLDVFDCAAADTGEIDYIEFWIYYHIPKPQVGVVPSSLAYRSDTTTTSTSESSSAQRENLLSVLPEAFVPGEILIKFRSDVSQLNADSVLAARGLSVSQALRGGTLVV